MYASDVCLIYGLITRYAREPDLLLRAEQATLLLLLLRRSPRALECGPGERQYHLGIGREDSEWGRRTTKGVLPEDIEVWASLQPVFDCTVGT